VSNIEWLQCPDCSYRFYIIEEHAGHGYIWFCPKCRREFTEDQSGDRAGHAPARPAM
jgi:DNA-directed RNA polymerase subunit RPC12/RpoP